MQKRVENSLSFFGKSFVDKTNAAKQIMSDFKLWQKTPMSEQNINDLISDVSRTLENVAIPEYTLGYFVNTPEYERLQDDLSDEAKIIVRDVLKVSANDEQYDSDSASDSSYDSDDTVFDD